MRTILLAALLCATGLVHGTSRADAQIEGTTRLHIDTGVVAFNYANLSADDVDESITSTSFDVNLGVPNFTLGLGYGLSENMVLGTSLLFNFTSTDTFGFGSSSLAVSLSPYINYVMGAAGDSVRPFVGAAVNFTYARSSDDADATLSAWALGGGPQGGLHIFLSDSVSLDLTGRLLALYGSGDAGGVDEFDEEFDASGNIFALNVAGFIGLSGWL